VSTHVRTLDQAKLATGRNEISDQPDSAAALREHVWPPIQYRRKRHPENLSQLCIVVELRSNDLMHRRCEFKIQQLLASKEA
jgi:hypothetical protein